MAIELRKYALALRFIRPGDVVIDAGAFVGYFSFLYSRFVGSDGIVFAYEPQPQALHLFANEVKKRNIQNIRICERAASYVSGQTVAMKVFSDSAEQSCTIEPGLMDPSRMPGSTAMIEVQTEALDSLEDDIGKKHLSFIKIDTEGHEDKVIEGAETLLRKHNPIVIMEYGFVPDRYEPNTIEQIGKMGYICFDIKNMIRVHPGYVSLSPTDLVAVPSKKMEGFREFLPDLLSMPPSLRLKILVSKVKLKFF